MIAFPQAEADHLDIHSASVENADGTGRFVILCDHASNRFPAEFGTLGLGPVEREAHIAWDPGALGVARRLAQLLDAPLVHGTVSRLVIDCNRPLDAPDLIPTTSEATPIPGNAALPDADRQRRIATVHEPYHRAIDDLIHARLVAGCDTALIAVHSFTPVFHGVARPWPVGIVFDRDRRLADVLIDGLRAAGLNVGANEPYAPADSVYTTVARHAGPLELAGVMIEIRNDTIRGEEEEQAWAERLVAALGPFFASAD